MRPLLVDNAAKEKVQRVLDYALQKEHWYRPKQGATPPGDIPEYVTELNTYRCVFSITETISGTFCHLSISVPPVDKYPNVFAAYTIAELFGFTGWDGKSMALPKDWIATTNPGEHCVVLAQKYEDSVNRRLAS